MFKLFISFYLILISVSGCGFVDTDYDGLPPKFDGPYVSVYGRVSCGVTKRMMKDLDSAGVTYRYFSVDDKESADDLHARMKASGISTRQYNLPVVDVGGDISVRPKSKEVLKNMRYRNNQQQ